MPVSGRWRRSSSAARNPSSARWGGICTSATRTSGRCASPLRRTSSASPACATTSKPASVNSRDDPLAHQHVVLTDHDAKAFDTAQPYSPHGRHANVLQQSSRPRSGSACLGTKPSAPLR